MGEVYRARDTRLKREVALKVLQGTWVAIGDRIARFEREAELLAAVNHPNIAAIYGIEESSGITALVLELVEGPTLADRLAHGAMPMPEVIAICRQIVDALDAAHERGIVHRDLKPANIKLREPFMVQHLHDPRRRWGSTPYGTAIVSNAFVVSQVETTGSIWLLDPRPASRRARTAND
jgi:eukaryotic-like serine/threonine-protein kinase